MPIRCYRKPNRSAVRHPSVAACRRFACAAVRAGVDRQEIRDELEQCLGDDDARRSRCDCERLLNILKSVAEVAAAIALGALLARFMPLILASLARFAIFLPASLRVLLPVLRQQAPQLRAAIEAIEAEYTVISREVAKEAARLL